MTWKSRREFLRLAAVTVAASTVPLACDDGEGDEGTPPPEPVPEPSTTEEVRASFPQGLASGDPRPDSVILWTRAPGAAEIAFYVATDEAFANVVARGTVATDAASDHTVRVKVTGLPAYATLYYRFTADGVTTGNGRTKTAPAPGQDVPVRFAFASCQDFIGRYYHSWAALLEEPDVDFVLFLGDYIYETTGDPRFQTPDETRKITFPDGLQIGAEGTDEKAALTLADYRSAYQQYRSDETLQRVHALFPFITIWDDHEFADDAWQDHSTHFNEAQGDEQDTDRRTAASRAWFEYQPADVTYVDGASFPDDLKIYRSLRYGAHLELFLTDQRSYRADHLIPEGPVDGPVGKTGTNTALGSRQFVVKSAFDAREATATPTMLGVDQRNWFIRGMRESDATWKVWGNETKLAQMVVDLSEFDVPAQFKTEFYFTVDQWDGYRSERKTILSALGSQVTNLVALTGDIHAFYAVELQADFDAPGEPVGVELVTAGISSKSVQEIAQNFVESSQTLTDLGLLALVPRFDELLQAAGPHYRYAKSKANGIAVVDLTAAALECTFLELDTEAVRQPTWDGAVTRTRFRVAAGTNRLEPLG